MNLSILSLRTYKPTVKGHGGQMKKVMEAIKKSEKPVIMAGGGVLLSDARNEVLAFAEKFDIPVASTMMAIDAVPSRHRLNLGMATMVVVMLIVPSMKQIF